MHHYFDAIQNTRGDALIGYYVRLTDSNGNGVSLYADANLTPIVSVSGVADAAKVDSDGNADFYVASGTYTINIYATDSTTFVKPIANVPMLDELNTTTAISATDRTALAAITGKTAPVYLQESGREGTFVWSTANNSANVTKDPQQGIYVAPTSDATGASGAWVRHPGIDNWKNVKWFGAKGDGTTDDHTAFQAAINYGSASGVGIYVPRSSYRISTLLTSTAPIHMFGDFVSQDATGTATPASLLGSSLYFDAGVGGLLLYYVTNLTAAGSPTIYPSAAGSIIERINFHSAGEGATHAGIYGIEARATCTLRDVITRGFGDHGTHIRGSTSGGDGVVYGNVNGSLLENVKSIGNAGAGLRISGNDANSITVVGGLYQINTGYGIDNDSFQGCTFLNSICEGNVAGAIITRRPIQAANTYIGIDTEGGTSVLGANDWVVGGGLSEIDQGQQYRMYGLVHANNALQVDGNMTAGTSAANSHVFNGRVTSWDGVDIRSGSSLRLIDAAGALGISIFNDGANLSLGVINTVPTSVWSLKIGGTTVINNAGALQAFAFPALTGDVTTTAGSLATTLSSATVVGKLSGQTLTGKLTAFTSAAGAASLTIPHGVAPTSPVNGDLWTTTAGIFWRINSATVQVSTGGGTATGTNTGDQTITLTGGVTGTGTGSFATVVASVPAAAMPALTGDVTTSAGAVATTVAKINGVALSGLATGILKNTTTTGVPSIAIAADFPTLNQNTTGSAATLTTPRTLSITGKATAAGGTFNGSADLAINVTALTVDGAITPTSVASTGAVTSSSATAGIGYASGSRGTVTQATSKATGATSNTVVTDITLNAAALASATTVSFVFTNSAITANDTLILNHVTTGTFGSYTLNAHGFSAGSCTIDVRNISAGSLSEAIVIRAVLVKGG